MKGEKKSDGELSNQNLCLATITTDDFVPGTFVLIHSFLKAHSWFQGDIIIIHDALAEVWQTNFTRCFDRVRFVSVSSHLKNRLHQLAAHYPELHTKIARFYSLEVFQLMDYDKVLFCDSDLLFCKPITELFEMEYLLICCGDGAHHRGNNRHAASFAEIDETANEATQRNATDMLYQTFNAGLLLIDRLLLNEQTYSNLLALLSAKTWQSIQTNHTDQILYNLYFAGQQTHVSAKYNYLLMHRAAIYAHAGIPLHEAHVLHFNGPTKPWAVTHALSSAQMDVAYIPALKRWYDAYITCLKEVHVKSLVLKS